MTTRMVHPEHGATHVYTPTEIESHKANGWQVECTIPGEQVSAAEVEPPAKPKLGRPFKVK